MSARSWSRVRASAPVLRVWARSVIRRIAAAARSGARSNPDRWAVPSTDRFHDDPPLGDRLLVAVGGFVGVGFETETTQEGVELAGGQPGRPFDYLFHYLSGGFLGEVGGTGDDHPDPTQVDLPGRQRLPHPGKPLFQIQRQTQIGIGRPAGQTQPRPDLGRGRLGGDLRILFDPIHQIGDRQPSPHKPGPESMRPSSDGLATPLPGRNRSVPSPPAWIGKPPGTGPVPSHPTPPGPDPPPLLRHRTYVRITTRSPRQKTAPQSGRRGQKDADRR